MPTISMFYGIVIYLYFFDDERHKLPHIHARYQGQEASFAIEDGQVSTVMPAKAGIQIFSQYQSVLDGFLLSRERRLNQHFH